MEQFETWWAVLGFIIIQIFGLIAASHAIVFKRDPKSSIAWTGLILLSPGIGALLYWFFGVNRINRRARRIFESKSTFSPEGEVSLKKESKELGLSSSLNRLANLTATISPGPLHLNNKIRPLRNGEETYPAIIQEIEKAQHYVFLCVYIFENDYAGKKIAKALNEASDRGVQVRVLVDDIGARYSFPTILSELKGKNLKASRFQKSFWPWKFHYAQLRNHRKLIVCDGRTAFIGGMNIRSEHFVSENPLKLAVEDIHFKVTGPIVHDLQEIFLHDWEFTIKSKYQGPLHRPMENYEGNGAMRVIPDGPDEDFDKMRWVILGAISSAEQSISIVTPYFIPEATIIAALGVAATKGIHVNIVLPENNNHKMVHWATQALLRQLLEKGCRIHFTPYPFDHSKLFVVDGVWSLLGSTNWDARSLRLNFELNIECYDADFSLSLQQLIDQKIEAAIEVTLERIAKRHFFYKLRDGVARLFSPYL